MSITFVTVRVKDRKERTLVGAIGSKMLQFAVDGLCEQFLGLNLGYLYVAVRVTIE